MSSLLRVGSWRALFHWSHMSHTMFHSFLMSSKVQHQLDFLDRICFHVCSCCFIHSQLSHPSQMCCFPIASCSSIGVDSSSVVGVGEVQFLRYSMSCLQRALSVLSSLSQDSNLFIDFSHHSQAAGVGHISMWCLSSCGSMHLGHWAEDQNHHLCMFFPLQSVLTHILTPIISS